MKTKIFGEETETIRIMRKIKQKITPNKSEQRTEGRFRTTSIIIAIAVTGLMIGTSLISFIDCSSVTSTDILQKAFTQTVIDRPTVISSYGSDDGVADAQIQGDYSMHKGMFKSFPSVTIPDSADMIIKVGISHVNPEILFCMNVTIGNVDGQHTFIGATIQETGIRFRGTASDYYLLTRINDIETKGLSDGQIGINCTAAYEADFTVGVDLRAEEAGYQSWHYAPTTWTNYSTSWRIMVDIQFVQKETNDSDKSLAQIQMGSFIDTSGDYWTNRTRYNFFNPENAIDGLQQITTGGYGWVANNKTTGVWVNLTFKDKIIISIGDSIMCGAPYHNPIPSLYGVNDYYYKSLQWRLGQLLGQPIANRGVSGQTTTQMLARFNTDVLAYNPDFVLIMAGINDIFTYDTPAAIIESNLQSMIDQGNGHGAKTVIYTILPDTNLVNATREAARVAVNAWIMSKTSSSVFPIDVATALADPADVTNLLALYDSGDGVHPSMAGYYLMANMTFASPPFNSTISQTTAHYVDSITLAINPSGISNPGRPMSINISFNGGYHITSLNNATNQTIDIGKVSTSWLKISFNAYHKVTAAAPAFIAIGEVRVYGLSSTWVKGSIFAGGWNNITMTNDTYGKLPYPRASSILMSASPSTYANVSIDAWSTSDMNWNATGTSSVSFTLSGLESGVNSYYDIYVDGKLIDRILCTSGSIIFSYSGPWSEHQFVVTKTKIVDNPNFSGLIILLIIVASISLGLLFFRYKEEYTITGLLYLLIGIFVAGILLTLAIVTFWS
jgi:lysophospholipase L1-like esterase